MCVACATSIVLEDIIFKAQCSMLLCYSIIVAHKTKSREGHDFAIDMPVVHSLGQVF